MSRRVVHAVKDPWEGFVHRFVSSFRDGVEIHVSYDGIEAGVALDEKALERLAKLFEKGVPLEVALGIDLPRILASLEGEELTMTLKTKEAEATFRFSGEVLRAFRQAMQHNPIDGDVLKMFSKLLRGVVG